MTLTALELRTQCQQKVLPVVATPPDPTTAKATSTVASSKSAKELPEGHWHAQVAKFEAVLIGDVKRRFPQELLLGAETVAANPARAPTQPLDFMRSPRVGSSTQQENPIRCQQRARKPMRLASPII